MSNLNTNEAIIVGSHQISVASGNWENNDEYGKFVAAGGTRLVELVRELTLETGVGGVSGVTYSAAFLTGAVGEFADQGWTDANFGSKIVGVLTDAAEEAISKLNQLGSLYGDLLDQAGQDALAKEIQRLTTILYDELDTQVAEIERQFPPRTLVQPEDLFPSSGNLVEDFDDYDYYRAADEYDDDRDYYDDYDENDYDEQDDDEDEDDEPVAWHPNQGNTLATVGPDTDNTPFTVVSGLQTSAERRSF